MPDGHLATLGPDRHPVQVAESATAAEPEGSRGARGERKAHHSMRDARGAHDAVAVPGPTQRATDLVGEQVTDWVTVALTQSGRVVGMFLTDQDPRITAILAQRGRSLFMCGPSCCGCAACR